MDEISDEISDYLKKTGIKQGRVGSVGRVEPLKNLLVKNGYDTLVKVCAMTAHDMMRIGVAGGDKHKLLHSINKAPEPEPEGDITAGRLQEISSQQGDPTNYVATVIEATNSPRTWPRLLARKGLTIYDFHENFDRTIDFLNPTGTHPLSTTEQEHLKDALAMAVDTWPKPVAVVPVQYKIRHRQNGEGNQLANAERWTMPWVIPGPDGPDGTTRRQGGVDCPTVHLLEPKNHHYDHDEVVTFVQIHGDRRYVITNDGHGTTQNTGENIQVLIWPKNLVAMDTPALKRYPAMKLPLVEWIYETCFRLDKSEISEMITVEGSSVSILDNALTVGRDIKGTLGIAIQLADVIMQATGNWRFIDESSQEYVDILGGLKDLIAFKGHAKEFFSQDGGIDKAQIIYDVIKTKALKNTFMVNCSLKTNRRGKLRVNSDRGGGRAIKKRSNRGNKRRTRKRSKRRTKRSNRRRSNRRGVRKTNRRRSNRRRVRKTNRRKSHRRR